MPTPPITVPHGQTVLWVPATSAAPFVGNSNAGTAVANLTAGSITQFASSSLGNTNEHITWSGYQQPNVLTRHDIVIHGIYPYIEYNGTVLTTDIFCSLGGVGLGGFPWSTVPGTSFTGSDFVSSGTDPSVIATLATTVTFNQTLPIGPYGHTDFINVTFVGIAVYIDTIPIPSVFIGMSNDAYTSVGVS